MADVEASFDDALKRHREDVFKHLKAWLEQLDDVLQRRLALDLENSDVDKFEKQVSGSSEAGASPVAAQRSQMRSEDLMEAYYSEGSPGRTNSPGRPSPAHFASNRSLNRSRSYEWAKAEETRREAETTRMQFSIGGLLSDLDQGAAKTRSALRRRMQQIGSFSARIVNTTCFNGIFAVIIISNSLWLGAQVELTAVHGGIFVHPAFRAIHFIYMGLFSVEIFLRCAAVGLCPYVFGSGWAWHWLDMVAVISSWVELAVDLFDQSGQYSSAASNFRILRIFRITRLVKVLRSLSLWRFIGALRTLVHSIADTLKPLCWALLLLLLIQYTFAILFTDAALDHIAISPDSDLAVDLQYYYGSVYKSTETLFRSLLGGLDWAAPANALLPIGIWWVQIFHWYIAFCSFAVLNVMTGVFCHSAITAAEHDHLKLIENRKRFKTVLTEMFNKMDTGHRGVITISQFESIFADEDMKAFFEAIEIDAVDAWTLFESLDVDGDFTINTEEFVERCMQLHGAARSVDLYALRQQSDKMRQQMDEIEKLNKKLARMLLLSKNSAPAEVASEGGDNDLRV